MGRGSCAKNGLDILGIDVSHPGFMLACATHCDTLNSNSLVLVALGDTDDQVVLLQVSPILCPRLPIFSKYMRRTMRVRTVRRVATLLREPWWSSILMRFDLGCVLVSSKAHVANSRLNVRARS